MKIIVIHNSIHGNGIIAAETLTRQFDKSEVEIFHNRDISPKTLIAKRPDLLILGSAVRKFVLVWESQRWVKQLRKELERTDQKITYLLGYITHLREVEKIYKKIEAYTELLDSIAQVENRHPEVLTLQVEEIEGPFNPETQVLLERVGNELHTRMMRIMEEVV